MFIRYLVSIDILTKFNITRYLETSDTDNTNNINIGYILIIIKITKRVELRVFLT